MSEVIIDVRERDEYAAEHVENSINVPLSVFATVVPGVLNQLTDRKIVFMCRSGMRAQQAKNIAANMGYNDVHTYSVFDGGLVQWMKDGKPVKRGGNAQALPLNRQVQITVGLMTAAFGAMGMWVDPLWSLVAGAMGAGLLVAGATGWCAMATFLAAMPWNKAGKAKGGARPMCASNSSSPGCNS